jgi:uncharacterized protein YcbK (DUF882 family)
MIRCSPRSRLCFWLGVLVLALCAPSMAAGGDATAPAARFFFSGDGVIDLYNAHFDEHLSVRYRKADGAYDPAALASVEHFFRSRDDGQSGPVSLRLVELIDFVQDHYRPSRLTLVSGYRSPDFNQSLRRAGHRVAQASLHTEGLAADLHPDGLDLRALWLDLRSLEVGGVGLYQADGFIHVDTGAPRFWEPATSGVEKNLSADNARLFARTDFDRYTDLAGAVVGLHSVTAFPLRIERTAQLGDRQLAIAPLGRGIAADGNCFVISEPAARYEFRVITALSPPDQRLPIRLHTCTPRIGKTAREIVTNPIEGLR